MQTIYGEKTAEEVEAIVAELVDGLCREQMYRQLKKRWGVENRGRWLDHFAKKDVARYLVTGKGP